MDMEYSPSVLKYAASLSKEYKKFKPKTRPEITSCIISNIKNGIAIINFGVWYISGSAYLPEIKSSDGERTIECGGSAQVSSTKKYIIFVPIKELDYYESLVPYYERYYELIHDAEKESYKIMYNNNRETLLESEFYEDKFNKPDEQTISKYMEFYKKYKNKELALLKEASLEKFDRNFLKYISRYYGCNGIKNK